MTIIRLISDEDILSIDVQNLWIKACLHDSIDPKSAFIVFSEDNPHIAELDQATIALMELRAAA